MVPDKNRAVFIRTSGGIPPVLISVDHVFLFLHLVIFIQTMFFTSIPLWFLFRLHFFKMLHHGFYSHTAPFESSLLAHILEMLLGSKINSHISSNFWPDHQDGRWVI